MAIAIAQWSLVGVVAFVASIYLASAVVWVVRSLGVAWSMETAIGATMYRVVTYVILTAMLGGVIYYRNNKQLVNISGVARLITGRILGFLSPAQLSICLALRSPCSLRQKSLVFH